MDPGYGILLLMLSFFAFAAYLVISSRERKRTKFVDYLENYFSRVDFAKKIRQGIQDELSNDKLQIKFKQIPRQERKEKRFDTDYLYARLEVLFNHENKKSLLITKIIFSSNEIDGPAGYSSNVTSDDYNFYRNRIKYSYSEEDKKKLIQNCLDQVEIYLENRDF